MFCDKCPNEARPDRKRCAVCAEKDKVRAKLRYDQLKQAGLCVVCRQQASPERCMCQFHLDRLAAHGRNWRAAARNTPKV